MTPFADALATYDDLDKESKSLGLEMSALIFDSMHKDPQSKLLVMSHALRVTYDHLRKQHAALVRLDRLVSSPTEAMVLQKHRALLDRKRKAAGLAVRAFHESVLRAPAEVREAYFSS